MFLHIFYCIVIPKKSIKKIRSLFWFGLDLKKVTIDKLRRPQVVDFFYKTR